MARSLGLEIEEADMGDVYAPLRLLPTLRPGDTMLVVWQHWRSPFHDGCARTAVGRVSSRRR